MRFSYKSSRAGSLEREFRALTVTNCKKILDDSEKWEAGILSIERIPARYRKNLFGKKENCKTWRKLFAAISEKPVEILSQNQPCRLSIERIPV